MNWIIYVVIAFCLILSIYFVVFFLKNFGRKKDAKLLEKSLDNKSNQPLPDAKKVETEEKEVSSAIVNKDAILKEFKSKNSSADTVENYEEFQERDFNNKSTNKQKIAKQENSVEQENISDEVENLSKTLKAILFTDIIKPKH